MRTISKLETAQRSVALLPEIGRSVVWTRLTGDGIVLSNGVEAADWESDPIFPVVCECGSPYCAAYGLARIRRTSTQLVWMPPTHLSQAWPPEEELEWRGISDALLIDGEEWDRIAELVTDLPPSQSFSKMSEGDLYRLWLQQRPAWAVERYEDSFVHHLRRHCIASHPLELEDAIAVFEELGERMSGCEREVDGRLERIDPDPDRYQTFYFDGRGVREFVAFSVEQPQHLVIAGLYVAR